MRWKRITRKQRDELSLARYDEKLKASRARDEKEAEWHSWFAWHPVFDQGNGYGMFMETVLRKARYPLHNILDRMFFGWEYRPLTILQKDLGLAPDDENGPTPRNG